MRRTRGSTYRVGWAVAAAAILISGCSEPEEATDGSSETSESGNGDGPVVERYAGEPWSLGTIPDEAVAADDSLEPIRIGLINTDTGAVAAMPELHQAADTAIAFINAELGGVDGHPIELIPCEVDLSPEKSASCARKMVEENVEAVLGGINIASGAAVKVLEENGTPLVGGIPLNLEEMDSPIAFQFSGGAPGAFASMAYFVSEVQEASTATVMYTDLPQIAAAATTFGTDQLEQRGVEVSEVTFDLGTQDYAAIVQKATQGNPDALIVGAADFACSKVMEALADLGTDAEVYMVGSCADRKWIDEVGVDRVAGTRFAIESRVDLDAVDVEDGGVYADAVELYGPDDLNPRGAGTVEFGSVMNLYAALTEIGVDDITPQAIIEYFENTTDHPNYNGHDFTCSEDQIEGLQSLCTTEGVIVTIEGDDPEVFVEVSDGWIDVPAVVAGTI